MAANDPLGAIEEDPCARFIRAAQQLRERIKRNTGHACELRASIVALQAAERPDQSKIQLLESEVARVAQQIRDEQAGLHEFEFEISLNC